MWEDVQMLKHIDQEIRSLMMSQCDYHLTLYEEGKISFETLTERLEVILETYKNNRRKNHVV